MSPELSLGEGTLAETLADLQNRIRREPANARNRIFLFELLSVLGEWERALTQLQVLRDLDAGALAMVETYREALRCEVLRAAVFAGKRSPLVFGEPEEWVALLIEALRHTGEGRDVEAEALRERAFEAAAATPGTVTLETADEGSEPAPREFAWIADADPRLGPVLETILRGRYYWIPFVRIRRVVVERPADLRDVVWMPASFEWSNGGESVGLIPTRYPGSETSPDGGIRLARKTEWIARTESTALGLGQRMLATDAGEIALMDVRRVVLAAVPGEGAAAVPPSDASAAPETGRA